MGPGALPRSPNKSMAGSCAPAIGPMISHRHAAGAASRVAGSAEGAEYFLVCRKPAGRLLGVGESAVHRDLEDTPAGPAQSNLRGGLGLQDRVLRRTGARFI